MAERLFTDAELGEHARSGAEKVAAAIKTGDAAEAQRVFEHVLAQYRSFHALYHGWAVSLYAFLDARYGHEVARSLTPLEDVLAHTARAGMDLCAVRVLQEGPERRFAEKLSAGDFGGAHELYGRVEEGARDLHDLYRDWVSTILTRVYRSYGVEALADSLRHSSERDWMPWMEQEVDSDPKERLAIWADVLGVGNFGNLTIEEHDDRFVIVQDPCGSCGRQHRGGRYDEEWNLAMIEEEHPVAYGTGGCTAYRAHIPMMHYIMPMERIGAPWPLIRCPRTKRGRCYVTLFKDARRRVPAGEVGWSDRAGRRLRRGRTRLRPGRAASPRPGARSTDATADGTMASPTRGARAE